MVTTQQQVQAATNAQLSSQQIQYLATIQAAQAIQAQQAAAQARAAQQVIQDRDRQRRELSENTVASRAKASVQANMQQQVNNTPVKTTVNILGNRYRSL